jgi:uncharacterized protein (DUF885 family)
MDTGSPGPAVANIDKAALKVTGVVEMMRMPPEQELRRSCATILAIAVAACAPSHLPASAPSPLLRPSAASAELNAVADAYVEAVRDIRPFDLVHAGLADRLALDNSSFDDVSPAAFARFGEIEDALARRLDAIDPEALGLPADLIVYHGLKERIEASREARICHREWWSLNPFTGWQDALAYVATLQSVETDAQRTDALRRWGRLPDYIAQDRANLETGLANGYSVPKRVVLRVLAQMDALAAAQPEQSPFVRFAMAGGPPEFTQAAKRLADDRIAPALADYRDYLRNSYLPRARETLAITALPDGPACYEALLRGHHSSAIGARLTYDRGMAAVAANRATVLRLGESSFGETTFAGTLEQARNAPGDRFSSPEELLAYSHEKTAAARRLVRRFFSSLPEQDLIVSALPSDGSRAGQSSHYESAPPFAGAATYRVRTDGWRAQSRSEAAILVAHEGWPGHHLQMATAQDLRDLHPVAQLFDSTAYVEGWGRYAEGLAEEAGLYDGGHARILRRSWQARGMVADPGLHLFGWTHDKVKTFLIESGRFNADGAEGAIDRIAAMPGQLTAYDTGALEIMALRREAEQRLGSRFDIREFHDRILENGVLPLAVLRAHVEKWIAREEQSAR